MQKFFKRTTSLLLTGLMVFSTTLWVNAAEAADAPVLLPLRMVFEANGAEVSWNDVDRTIIVNHDDDTIIFHPGSPNAYRNDEPFQLAWPIEIGPDNRARIVYDDIAFLFEGPLAATKRTAVETAYTLLEALDIAGLTIAIVDRDSGYTWTQGIGFADVATGRYVNELTLFDIGSISKPFAAVAVLQLVDQGVIDLDEPIITYLPDFSVQPHPVHGGDYTTITARMLLSHFSGLPTDFFGGMGTIGQHYRGYMNNFLPRMAAAHMDNAQLQRMSYENNAFTLAGILVAHMAGHDDFFQGYLDFTSENIFIPAGMYSTTFLVGPDTYASLPYITASLPPDQRVFANVPSAGGLYSNAYDMARFMHFILNGGSLHGDHILSPESVTEMFTIQDFDFSLSPTAQMGLGTMRLTHPVNGLVMAGHGGNWMQFHSEMQFHFDTGIGVFVSTNSTSGVIAPPTLVHAVLTAAVYEKTGHMPTIETLPPGEPTELSREELAQFTGYYTLIGRININEDGVLYAPTVPGVPFPLEFTPHTDGSFGALGQRFWFEEISGRMAIFQGDHKEMIVAERIDTMWQADEAFAQWVGTYAYYSITPNALPIVPSLTLGVDDYGYAFISSDILPNLPIGQIDDSTFYILGTGRNLGPVIRLHQDNGTISMYFAGTKFVK